MAKKKSSNNGAQYLINTLVVAVGIYLVVTGIMSDMSQSWSAFCIALGLGLQTTGTIGFAKLK